VTTLDRLVERLLAERGPGGYWTGELSSSALATALATIALGDDPLAAKGLEWLEKNRNADGGWGDTVRSVSNISTTALCWAAFRFAGRTAGEEWVKRAAGSLEAAGLAEAIASRYGNDRTFSVPILMVLAVAGIVPWRLVPQLPFELAACPQAWFRRLRLPVVSYALPALIAIGQARHRRYPSRNLPARLARDAVSAKTLVVLERIQPSNGGFLEAVPLTSFVAIGLAAAGFKEHPVRRKALMFLRASVRGDGSWPIDTNLATWVTTLAVNALGGRLTADAREPIREWLLRQQHRELHPYTGAAPGGWAWTDLPGGVPDADDTSGALLALAHLGESDERILTAARAGVSWLLDLQNRDGGVPTFCRGWGKLTFDRSSPDITAHALLAWCAWRAALDHRAQGRVDAGMRRAIRFLEGAQRSNGAWVPLWFGNQFAANDENPVYGTARVLAALRRVQPGCAAASRATEWLLSVQNANGGWGGDSGIAPTIEETAVVLAALDDPVAIARGAAWLARTTHDGADAQASPIGFYFARLWYFERLYPLVFAVAALQEIGQS
jgi:squalene-hopene/tetraprenyl-beta-curcumene cyclase